MIFSRSTKRSPAAGGRAEGSVARREPSLERAVVTEQRDAVQKAFDQETALLLDRALEVVEHMEQRCADLEAERLAAERANGDALAAAAAELAARDEQAAAADRAIAELNDALRFLAERTLSLAGELAHTQARVEDVEGQLTAREVEMAALQQARGRAVPDRQMAQAALEGSLVQALRADAARKDSEIAALTTARDLAVASARTLEARLACLQQRVDDTGELRRLRRSLDDEGTPGDDVLDLSQGDVVASPEAAGDTDVADRRRKRRTQAA